MMPTTQSVYDVATAAAYAAADAIVSAWGLSQNGSATPNGQFHDAEIPGLMDGSNATFSLVAAPAPAASLQLTRNGLMQCAGGDYSLVDRVITFVPAAIPETGDIIQAWYRS